MLICPEGPSCPPSPLNPHPAHTPGCQPFWPPVAPSSPQGVWLNPVQVADSAETAIPTCTPVSASLGAPCRQWGTQSILDFPEVPLLPSLRFRQAWQETTSLTLWLPPSRPSFPHGLSFSHKKKSPVLNSISHAMLWIFAFFQEADSKMRITFKYFIWEEMPDSLTRAIKAGRGSDK